MFHPDGPTFLELTRQALSSTEKGYDLLAPKFDHTPFRTPAPLLADAAQHLEALEPRADMIDLCCGTGAGLEWLRPLCRHRLVGIDFSHGMLEMAAKNLARKLKNQTNVEETVPTIDLVHANIFDLAYEDEFDLVTCFSASGHILPRDEARFVRLVARMLRSGGHFVAISAEKPPLLSLGMWLALAFNGVMKIRNALWRPPFIMYYLTFLLPRARRLLEEAGFEVELHPEYCADFPRAQLIVATKT